mmetsp:Transcript_27836/g.64832  ORF Transcript_27836/g.64832 Transcript_27836/m.64832 type:complete len:242 (-) Transcript_27836:102-827(-)
MVVAPLSRYRVPPHGGGGLLLGHDMLDHLPGHNRQRPVVIVSACAPGGVELVVLIRHVDHQLLLPGRLLGNDRSSSPTTRGSPGARLDSIRAVAALGVSLAQHPLAQCSRPVADRRHAPPAEADVHVCAILCRLARAKEALVNPRPPPVDVDPVPVSNPVWLLERTALRVHVGAHLIEGDARPVVVLGLAPLRLGNEAATDQAGRRNDLRAADARPVVQQRDAPVLAPRHGHHSNHSQQST